MKTFGKRTYTHLELNPFAKRSSRPADTRSAGLSGRAAVYALALVVVGVVAFASLEMLILA